MGRAMGWANQPNPSQGYYQGVGEGPFTGGQGSMAGPITQGLGFFSKGQGPTSATAGSWDPTIIYLLLLTIGEMVVFGVISRILR
ncbi:MAG TPA: hypothetical protein VN714_24365 [Trebonia sp.]|nr:hypothetical protein [Trebonia sp.]